MLAPTDGARAFAYSWEHRRLVSLRGPSEPQNSLEYPARYRRPELRGAPPTTTAHLTTHPPRKHRPYMHYKCRISYSCRAELTIQLLYLTPDLATQRPRRVARPLAIAE